ncbi:MAG: hypothetical protein QW228_02960 [Candidatus Aenigmatarchaeota archaeon]
MVKLFEYAKTPIRKFIREVRDVADYVHVYIEHRKIQGGKFRDGKAYNPSVEYTLGMRITFLKENELFLYSATEDLPSARIDREDVEFLIKKARENVIKTDVIIPKKELVFPEKSYVEEDKNFVIPHDFIKEIKEASKNKDPSLRVFTKYNLTQRTIYQRDSNNVEVFQVIPNFLLKFMIYISPEESIQRNLGMNPVTQTDITNLHRLIKTIPDITLEQSLRDANSYHELIDELSKIAKNVSENGIRIGNGLYDVITPSSTVLHEIFGHSFEGSIKLSRKDWEESKYEMKPIFDGLNGIQLPKSLSLIDSPLIETSSRFDVLQNFWLFGGFNHDFEMFPAEEKMLISKGKLTGRKLGSMFSDVNETGNAISSEFSFIPQPRSSILYALPSKHGPKSIEEMGEVASRKENVLVMYKSVGEHLGEDAFVRIGKIGEEEEKELELSTEVYFLKDGELLPVRTPLHLTLPIYQISSQLVLSSYDLYFYDPGYCAKTTPTGEEDLVPSSQVGPMVLMKNVPVITYEKRIQV